MHPIEIKQINIPYDTHKRTIRIYLPPNYDESKQFPVLYMHDAQNLFDKATSTFGEIWDVHVHLDRYYRETGQGIIVIGIDNWAGRNNRLNEYSPWINTTIKSNKLLPEINEDVGGLGDQYLDFIVQTLKPWVDAHYKTLPERCHTGIIGSSMGGLISLYAGMKYHHVFSKIGAFSSAIWFAESEIISSLEKLIVEDDDRWYQDIGTNETSNHDKDDYNQIYLDGNRKVSDLLNSKLNKEQYLYFEDEGGIHNEKDWSKRFYAAIQFLFS